MRALKRNVCQTPNRAYFTEDGEPIVEVDTYRAGEAGGAHPGHQEDLTKGREFAGEIAKMAEETRLCDDPYLPNAYLGYFYVAGAFADYLMPVLALEEEEEEEEEGIRDSVPESWQRVRPYVVGHFRPKTWAAAVCKELRDIFGDQRYTGERTESGDNRVATMIVDAVQATGFLDCFDEEPSLKLMVACLMAAYFALCIEIPDSEESDFVVSVFRSVLDEFGIALDSATIEQLNEWKETHEALDPRVTAAFAFHMLRDVFVARDQYLQDE